MSMVDTRLAATAAGTQERLVAQASPGALAIIKPFAAAALRHVATAAGAYLVAKGVTDSNGATGFVGAVMTIGGIGWSWYEKYGSAMAKQALSDAADLLHAAAARARTSTTAAAGIGGGMGGGGPSDRQRSTGG